MTQLNPQTTRDDAFDVQHARYLIEQFDAGLASALVIAARLPQACNEIEALRTRQQELLVTIRNLSAVTPYPDEAGNAAVLIAEVGTLKAALAEAQRDAIALRHVAADLNADRDHLSLRVVVLRDQLTRVQEERDEIERRKDANRAGFIAANDQLRSALACALAERDAAIRERDEARDERDDPTAVAPDEAIDAIPTLTDSGTGQP